jgi:hypothetical protein
VAAVLNSSAAGAALYTSVLIRPTTDGVVISGASPTGRGIIELNGADSVTIDGDNPNTPGTNRNLTIQNTAVNTTTFTSVVRVALSTLTLNNTGNNNAVRNTVVLGSATGRNIATATSTTGSEFTTYGILVGGGASTVAATTPPSAITSVTTVIGSPITATNFTATNNKIDACARGIAMQGSAVTVAPGLTVTNNVIGSDTPGNTTTVYARGMTLQGFDAATIAGNTIQNIEFFVGTVESGLSLGDISANGQNSIVERNVVTNVFNQAPGTFGAYGINVNAGTGITVRNNFVSNINHVMTGGAAFNITNGVFGIRLGTGGGHRVYHNSVNLFGVMPGTPKHDPSVGRPWDQHHGPDGDRHPEQRLRQHAQRRHDERGPRGPLPARERHQRHEPDAGQQRLLHRVHGGSARAGARGGHLRLRARGPDHVRRPLHRGQLQPRHHLPHGELPGLQQHAVGRRHE